MWIGGRKGLVRLREGVDPEAMVCVGSYPLCQQPPGPLSLSWLVPAKELVQTPGDPLQSGMLEIPFTFQSLLIYSPTEKKCLWQHQQGNDRALKNITWGSTQLKRLTGMLLNPAGSYIKMGLS